MKVDFGAKNIEIHLMRANRDKVVNEKKVSP